MGVFIKNYDKEPIIIKDSIIEYIEFTEKAVRTFLVISFIICILLGFHIGIVGIGSGWILSYFIEKFMDKYGWRRDANIYFYNDFIKIEGEHTKILKLNNINKIDDKIILPELSYKKLKLFILYLFIFMFCFFLYTYYLANIALLEIVLVILLITLFLICYGLVWPFAFRLKKRLNLNLLEGNVDIFTSNYTLDIYFLDKKEFNEIKEYFLQRINFKI